MSMGSRRKQSRTFDDSEGEVVQGRWTKDEHQRFVEALSMHGKNWKKVEEHVGTRNGAQIRSHAQKFFNRLEKEFHQQFNGLKSSEIKAIFENKIFHKYYEGEQQKRARTGSFNDISQEEDPILNAESQEQASKEQPNLNIKDLLSQLDQPFPLHLQPHVSDQIDAFNKDKLLLQQKMQEIPNAQELQTEAQQLCHRKQQIISVFRLQEAHNNLQQQTSAPGQVEQNADRPGQNESFYQFIIAKYQKYLNKWPDLQDIVNEPLKHEDEENEQGEVSKSRKQSFNFYNDQLENEVKQKSYKKLKKD